MSFGWAMRPGFGRPDHASRRPKLMLEERFPRIWLPSEEERGVRQLLMDRHHRRRRRAQVKNQLQSLALNQGLQKGKKLWSQAGLVQLTLKQPLNQLPKT
jgi:transposase